MTNEEFKEMYQEYNDELYHSWVTSLDPVKRAAQQAKQKAYNAAYYLRNKAKWLKYNAKQAGREMKRNFKAHNENWGRGVDMIRDANGRLQRRISSGLDRLTGYNSGYDALSPEQLSARETASRNKAARYQRTARARRRYQQARNRQKTAARNRAMNAAYNQTISTRGEMTGNRWKTAARNRAMDAAYNQAVNTREPLRGPSASAQARNAFTSAYEALMPWKKKKR